MIRTISDLLSQAFGAYSDAMVQTRYLRRHGYLREFTIARLAQSATAKTASTRTEPAAAADDSSAIPLHCRFAQEH